MSLLLSSIFGGTTGLGVWLLLLGLRKKKVITKMAFPKQKQMSKENSKRLIVGACIGGLAWLFTGIPVAGFLLGVGFGFFRGRLGSKEGMRKVTERSEAIANWTEMLYSILIAGGGLEKAITISAPIAPENIRPQVSRLAENLKSHPMPVALNTFGEEMKHPATDKIVAALTLSVTRGAQDLVELLKSQAESIRADSRVVMEVETGRSRHRTSARIIIGVTLVVAVGLYIFEEGYLQPYRSFPGYLVLLLVGFGFMLGFGLLIRMGSESSQQRYFDFNETEEIAEKTDLPKEKARV